MFLVMLARVRDVRDSRVTESQLPCVDDEGCRRENGPFKLRVEG
jgi:hypothetical protein